MTRDAALLYAWARAVGCNAEKLLEASRTAVKLGRRLEAKALREAAGAVFDRDYETTLRAGEQARSGATRQIVVNAPNSGAVN